MLKKKIQEKIYYLWAKYSQFTIHRTIPINFNLLNKREVNYNYLNNNAFFNLKKKKFFCQGEFGLFCGLLIIVLDIVEPNNKIFKKIKIKNSYYFKKKSFDKLVEDNNFLSFCEEFFNSHYFYYNKYIENIENFSILLFLDLSKLNMYDMSFKIIYDKIIIKYLYFDKIYNLNCLSLNEESELIKKNYKILNDDIYNYDKNLKTIEEVECEINIYNKWIYINTIYDNIKLILMPFNVVNNNIIKKLKKEFFTFGVINYYETYNEYISFCDEGLFCGIKIIEMELFCYYNCFAKEYQRYLNIEINGIIYDFDFYIDPSSDRWDYETYRNIIKNFLKYKKFKLNLRKDSKLFIEDFFFYFFYEENPFIDITLNDNNLNRNLIIMINQNDIFINENKDKLYFFKK